MIVQRNLQIHCDAYQAFNGMFHRTRTNHSKMCVKTQKNLCSQTSLVLLEKEEQSGITVSDFKLYYKAIVIEAIRY